MGISTDAQKTGINGVLKATDTQTALGTTYHHDKILTVNPSATSSHTFIGDAITVNNEGSLVDGPAHIVAGWHYLNHNTSSQLDLGYACENKLEVQQGTVDWA